jgi:cyclophilin family peptidyl-prolyl cis-trans isomerase
MRTVRRLVVFAVAVGTTSCMAGLGGRASFNADTAVPDSFVVAFETSRGRFDVMAHTEWSPAGVDRFYQLVNVHFYDDARFFRVVKDFVAQFGIPGDPSRNKAWRLRRLADEPVRKGNSRGRLAYARGGPGTRTVQLFINLKDNARLDTLNGYGFPAFAEVVSGMSVVDSLYQGYGEAAPRPTAQATTQRDTSSRVRLGPQQDSITVQGTPYLLRGWPKLDYIKKARVVREWRTP